MKAAKYSVWALLSLVFISLAIRPPVASIGPLVDELVRTELLTIFQVDLQHMSHIQSLVKRVIQEAPLDQRAQLAQV